MKAPQAVRDTDRAQFVTSSTIASVPVEHTKPLEGTTMFTCAKRSALIATFVLSLTAGSFAADSDGDGIDDSLDLCCDTPAGVAVDAQGRPIGDFDLDCDNDLADFAIYITGFTGPLSGQAPCAECTSSIDCDDSNPCTTDVCLGDGTCQNTPNTGLACDDGNACTVGDVCVGSACVGSPAVCDDSDPCTTDACNPGTGSCVFAPNDGAACTDGDSCTHSDVCSGGACIGVPFTCDDGNPCTSDACAAGMCVFSPLDGAGCDDGNACTVADTCTSGVCIGEPLDCSHLDNICIHGVCNPATGACQIAPDADGSACDDGQACTALDQCFGGTCTSTPVDCSHLDDQCNVGLCDENLDICVADPLPSGTPCDDGNAMTVGDACDGAGSCFGTIP